LHHSKTENCDQFSETKDRLNLPGMDTMPMEVNIMFYFMAFRL